MATAQYSENGESCSVTGHFSVPRLSGTDMYHVFISFSGADSPWVHRLIHKLEDTFPEMRICTHERDFTAGKTIIENMTECIQNTQKILMVLSPDFVRSRWCLFEANLSMFQDCMSHKVIVPVMLKPCPMPLYLSHLTYLEVEDEQFFEKLCNRLLKTNAKETEDVLVHFQSSILYGGKHLLSLAAVNEDDDSSGGVFSNTCVPDSLKAVVKDPEIYRKAIQLINDTPRDIQNSTWMVVVMTIWLVIPMIISIMGFSFTIFRETWWCDIHLPMSWVAFGFALYRVGYWKKKKLKRITKSMSQTTGEANLLLAETSMLAGCVSRSNLVFIFASVRECREMFRIAFDNDTELANCMWKKAMIKYSSDYANCMAKKHFPCRNPRPPGHLANGICFCQYVAMEIEDGNWP